MSDSRNKAQSQANWQLVQKALNEHWDPLDVSDMVDHEYDRYVDAICHMLMDRHVAQETTIFIG
jgi:hypothetical protein